MRRRAGFRGMSLVELMTVVSIIGILSSIAIPQFLIFQARARQAEVKTTLRRWYLSEMVYFGEKGTYTESLLESGFALERGNRYAYLFGQSCIYDVRATAASVTIPPGANCVTIDQLRFPNLPLVYPVPSLTVSFLGAGADPRLPGLNGTGPDVNIAGVAVGNLDNESTGVDTWVVTTKGGSITPCGSDETHLVPGIPLVAHNDAACN